MPTNADSDGNSYLLPVIYMYDLSTPKQTHISTSEAAISTAIYGDKIVWMGCNGEGSDYEDLP